MHSTSELARLSLSLAASLPHSAWMPSTHITHVAGLLKHLTRPLARLLKIMWDASVRFAFGYRPSPTDEEAATTPLLSDEEAAPTQPIVMTDNHLPRLPNDNQEPRDLPNSDQDWDPNREPLLGFSTAQLPAHSNSSFVDIHTVIDSPSLEVLSENMGGSLISRRTASRIDHQKHQRQMHREAMKNAQKAANGRKDLSRLLQAAQEHAGFGKAIALSQAPTPSHPLTSYPPDAAEGILPSQEQMDIEKAIALSLAPRSDTVRPRATNILSQPSPQADKSSGPTPPVGSIQQPESGAPFRVLDPLKLVALKLLLNPVHHDLVKLKATTPASLPKYHPSIRSKHPKHILKTRLLPIGECIAKNLSHVPEDKRGALELDICLLIAQEYWPLPATHMTFLHIHTMYRNALFRRVPHERLLAERKQQEGTPLSAPRTSFGEAAARLFGRLTMADPSDRDEQVQDVPKHPHATDEEIAARLAREYKDQQEREDRLMAEGMNEWMDDWETKPPKSKPPQSSPVQIVTMKDHACLPAMSGGLPGILTTGESGKLNGNRNTQNSKAVTPGTSSNISSNPPATLITVPILLPLPTTPNPLGRLSIDAKWEDIGRKQWETDGGQAVLGDFDTYNAMTHEEQTAMRRKIQREENSRAIKEKMAMARREREEKERVKEKGNKRAR